MRKQGNTRSTVMTTTFHLRASSVVNLLLILSSRSVNTIFVRSAPSLTTRKVRDVMCVMNKHLACSTLPKISSRKSKNRKRKMMRKGILKTRLMRVMMIENEAFWICSGQISKIFYVAEKSFGKNFGASSSANC